MSDVIGLTLDADTSAIIAKLNNLENRYGRLERVAADAGKAKTKAFQDSAAAGEKMNKSLADSSGLMSKIGGLAAGLGIAAGITAFAYQAFEATKSMQGMEAAFTTAFSSEGVKAPLVAAGYMKELAQIAKETPFEFEELAKAMLKLTEVDFTPSKTEITQLGDLAASQNKGIDQLSEAILDAQTNSYERLKEFQIKAETAGNKVNFSFKGITTTVDNNKTAIRNAIIEMGKYDGVAGGMALQSKTLGGVMSNLSDSIFQLGAKIGGDLSPEIAKGIASLSEFIGSLDTEKIFAFFRPITDKLVPALQYLYESLVETAKAMTGSATEGELMEKVMKGLSFAFELVVDALTFTVDYFASFSNELRTAYQEGGIFTAVVDGIGFAINGLGDAVKFIIEGLQKLYLGEDEFNKRQVAAVEAEKQRGLALVERKKKEEESTLALDEHRKKTVAATAAKKDNKDAIKAQEKALKEYADALKNADKIIADFEQKRKKANIDNLQGVEKIEAEKALAIEEVQQIIQSEDKKLEVLQGKYNEGSNKYEEVQKRRNLLVDAYLLQEKAINIRYANEILDFKKSEQEKEEKALIESLENKEKILSDAQSSKDNDFKGNVDFAKQQSDINSAELDLQIQAIEAKGNLGQKEIEQIADLNRQKLQLQIDYLVQIRGLTVIAKGENSPEVALIDNQIKGLKIGLEKLANDKSILNPIAKFKAKLAKELGLSNEDLDALIGGVQQGIQAVGQIISQANEDRIAENEKLIDSLKGRISGTEAALKKEEELKAKGLANNVSGKTAELKALHDEERKAEARSRALKKEALKRQLAADLLSQASSTTVAVSGYFAANSAIPIVGAIIAAAGIAAMIGTIAKFKSERKALETQLYTGGSLSDYLQAGESDSGFIKKGGSSDSPGSGGRGYKIQGTNIRVGGNEFLLNEKTSLLNADFLQKMNTGFFDKEGGVQNYFAKKQSPSLGVTVNRIERIEKEGYEAQHKRNDYNIRAAILEGADKQIAYWKTRKDRVQTADGYIEFGANSKTRVRIAE